VFIDVARFSRLWHSPDRYYIFRTGEASIEAIAQSGGKSLPDKKSSVIFHTVLPIATRIFTEVPETWALE
jgi:hypothetical protein